MIIGIAITKQMGDYALRQQKTFIAKWESMKIANKINEERIKEEILKNKTKKGGKS